MQGISVDGQQRTESLYYSLLHFYSVLKLKLPVRILEFLQFRTGDTCRSLTCPGGGLFMVLRARWILWGAAETEGGEDAVPQEEAEKGVGGGRALLLAGPERLIFALPGDNVIDVDGDEDIREDDVDGSDFAA